ncbi:MAG: hypothetical protein RID90_16900 [Marinovum algicola]|uniref:hypothetical protein n=1 Tax=Marinovum algicola TaxID=42444 RepID=UPI0032EC3E33
MAKIDIQPFEANASGGITIGYVASASGHYIRIGISKAAQERYFGGPIDLSKHRFRLELDDAPELRKHAMLTRVDARQQGALGAIGGGFEAVSLKVLPWVERRQDKLKSQGVPVEAVSEFGVRLSLPLWAQPGRPKTSAAPKKIGEGQSLMDDLPMRK